jgi:hypothetical protein
MTLDRTERRLVTEAAALLALAGAALACGGFARSRPLLARWARRGAVTRAADASDETPSIVAWAVAAVAGRLPFSKSCLVKALVTDVMLRRRGLSSSLYVGVRRGRSLAAHAWVESDGAVVIGGLDDLTDYTVLSGARLL